MDGRAGSNSRSIDARRNRPKPPNKSLAVRQIGWLLLVITALPLLCGCGRKGSDRNSAKPSDLPAEMVESIVRKHWMRDSVKVNNITYERPFPSQGGRVPPGVKIIPAKVRVSINGAPDTEVQLYFYQNPFGAWETYAP